MHDAFSDGNILFGGDYNPDQWDKETVERDMELFKEAGVNILTLPVFSWTRLEPEEGRYEFEWLDELLDLFEENGLHYFLATPTAAVPAWMVRKYPETALVDISGRRKTFGSRTLFCLNSEKYRERAAEMAERLVDRYGQRKGLAGWHVANEYGHYCYCGECRGKFAQWLKERYGTLSELNRRLNTAFWNRTYTGFDEITVPSELNDDNVCNPALKLCYQRFMTDSTIGCFLNEARILKKGTPELSVFTNMSSNLKSLDQNRLLEHMDVAGWDNYPDPYAPMSFSAMEHDIMRGLRDGQSYYVMEQSPNQQNWQPYNKVKRPGQIRELAYQGLAHGADSSMYFQMRQSVSGVEKFHGALIAHNGRTDTKVFKEMKQLGAELKRLSGVFVKGETKARAGILMDWENWWALENNSGPSRDIDYLKELHHYYSAFYRQNLQVDFIKVTSELSGYRVILAPLLYMMTEELGERLETFVRDGGILISTYLTGYADPDDRCIYGAYPGPLRETFGIWVEETDALFEDEKNRICMTGRLSGENGGAAGGTEAIWRKEYSCDFLCDRIHADKAEILAVYGDDFYKGEPCVTMNRLGKGRAIYLASRPEAAFLDALVLSLMADTGMRPLFPSEGEVEITSRAKNGKESIFIICHDPHGGSVDLGGQSYTDILTGRILQGKTELSHREVLILSKEQTFSEGPR